MEERKARALFPVWADDVKEYRPRNEIKFEKPLEGFGRETPTRKEIREAREKGNTMIKIQDAVSDFLRNHLITILILTAFALEGWIVAVYTEHRVSREVRQTVEAEMRQGFAEYLAQKEEEKKAAEFLTGEASQQAAINDLGGKLAIHAAGLRMDRKVTKAGAETYLWVDVARMLSGKYGATIDDVLAGPVENFDPNHAVRDEDREIGMKVASAVISGTYPNGFTQELQFAEINADGSVTARSKLKTDSTTVFWRIEE